MIIIIFCVGLLMLSAGIFLWLKYGENKLYYKSEVYCVLNAVGATICIITLVAGFILGGIYSHKRIIADEIALYQEENARIEKTVEMVVNEYKKYEHDTFTEITGEDAVTLVTIYPELKTDKIVTQQIEVYISNKNKILSLKEKELSYKVIAWWLFLKGDNNGTD